MITGYVQGVGFRASCRWRAREIGGITGYVKNLYNGDVEVVAEGEETKLTQLIEWCKRGPIGSKVDKVDIIWEDPKGDFKDFKIF